MAFRLYMDEDSMDRDLVRALKARGMDVTTALAEGMIDREDAEHLEYATAQGRVLFSFNVADYCVLHALRISEGRSHGGIVLARQQHYTVGESMRRLLKLNAAKSAAEMQGQLEFLSVWG